MSIHDYLDLLDTETNETESGYFQLPIELKNQFKIFLKQSEQQQWFDRSKPIEALFEDITNKKSFEYSSYEKFNEDYENASVHAIKCLENGQLKTLASLYYDDWLRNALKMFDVIVLHYIAEVLNETIPPDTKSGNESYYERQVYTFLEKTKDEDLKDVGKNLTNAYKIRNKFEHRQKIMNGKRKVIPVTSSEFRNAFFKAVKHIKTAAIYINDIYQYDYN